MAETIKKPVKFLKDVSNEMKRVTWPTRSELVRYTIIVVTTVAFIAVFFAVVDTIISWLLQLLLD
ncbi:preprotein translocase subunit SecE [Texcoconibacillus texcoconensis]|uniref:Protein translocase subunit SecE n=1 Tax=Texcoconibacillus texcoconensis TaxID=1095777 RepID=A0A840QUQ0_9BACI|nr:preprotein translocase subunit SecE [Texcoconibacillus texcoconensis]